MSKKKNLTQIHVSGPGKGVAIFLPLKSGGSEQRILPLKPQWEMRPLTEREKQIAADLPGEPFLHW